MNPNGANCSTPRSLNPLDRSAILLAPTVVDPNNAAKFCALPLTSCAKSSNGSNASPAALLKSTMLFPKLAPVSESCLNVSMLVSSLEPNPLNASPSTPLPLNTPVKELIVPSPRSTAVYNPPRADETLLILSLYSSSRLNFLSNSFSSCSSNLISRLRV